VLTIQIVAKQASGVVDADDALVALALAGLVA
jgi:hypothetical protein